jgi:hypothetical protein
MTDMREKVENSLKQINTILEDLNRKVLKN